MDVARVEGVLQQDRAATRERRKQLRRDLDDVIAAAADVATDDEHDPEGATIAYERSRTQALLEQADTHLGEIASALERLQSGSYGICEACGATIAEERLEARPVVRTCIACASRVAR
ncbi:MAG TPA: TraR/DksA C4-type zinc finger protein [Mycobacteriales bacterium]|nr:TraR/DksA C4-type zinc finger protein [Mycobacteriales bacterium]